MIGTRSGRLRQYRRTAPMTNPFQSLKYLPWYTLLLSAGLTVLVTTALDVLLFFAIMYVPGAGRLLLGNAFLQLVITIAVPCALGGLAIFFTEQFFPQLRLNKETIWALIGCLLLILWLKTFLPMIPAILLPGINLITILLLAVGSFTAGRRYWRY